MANEKLKFYRATSAPSNPKDGYIWFNPNSGSISIYKTDKWENYSGLLDATYSSNKLTITKKDGTTLTVDLSSISSIGDLSTRLGTAENDIKTIKGNITTLSQAVNLMKGSVDAIPTTVSTEVTTQLDALDATVWSTGGNTTPDFKTNANKNKRVAVKVVQTDGKITGVEVLENDIATATSVGNVNDRIDVIVGTNTNDANKSIRSIATDVLTEVLVDKNADEAYNSLAEMSAWLQSHPESAAAMNLELEQLKGTVSDLQDANVVSTFGGKTGDITVRGSQTTNGSVNLAMNKNELQASIVGLGTIAYKNSLSKSDVGLANVSNIAATDYLTDFKVDETNKKVSITVGGTTKTITNADLKKILAEYFDAAGDANKVLGATSDDDSKNTVYGVKAYADSLLTWAEY